MQTVTIIMALCAVQLLDGGKTLEEVAAFFSVPADALQQRVDSVRNIGKYKPQLIIQAMGAKVTFGRTQLEPAIRRAYPAATQEDIDFALLGLSYVRMKTKE